jgi:hypothetical protein
VGFYPNPLPKDSVVSLSSNSQAGHRTAPHRACSVIAPSGRILTRSVRCSWIVLTSATRPYMETMVATVPVGLVLLALYLSKSAETGRL